MTQNPQAIETEGDIPAATSNPVTQAPVSPSPTATLIPTATSYWTPTPAGSLLTHGPWLAFVAFFDSVGADTSDDLKFVAVNADGSGLTTLMPGETVLAFSPSPVGSIATGIDVAYLGYAKDAQGKVHPALKFLHLPDRTVRVAALIDGNYGGYPLTEGPGLTGLVWSHDGKRIAFIGGKIADAEDLYVYSLDTQKLTRITSGANAFFVWWSPNDQYIAFAQTEYFTSQFYSPVRHSLYAARTDGAAHPIELQPNQENAGFYGWYDNTRVIVGHDFESGGSLIQQVDVVTGGHQVIKQGDFISAEFDPDDNAWVTFVSVGDCETSVNQFVLESPNLRKTIDSRGCGYAQWLQGTHAFVLHHTYDDTHAILLSPDGTQQDITIPMSYGVEPLISSDGRYWAWGGQTMTWGAAPEVWISEAGNNRRRIYHGGIYNLLWVPNSDTLLIGSHDGLYVASAPDFTTRFVVQYQPDVSPQFDGAKWIP